MITSFSLQSLAALDLLPSSAPVSWSNMLDSTIYRMLYIISLFPRLLLYIILTHTDNFGF